MWEFHEQSCVTQRGGLAIVSSPNFAALHCRIQLMFGKHPSCLKIDDAHRRGFTYADFVRVIENIPGLEIIDFGNANLYGVPT
jgi:hypothetical protein